MKKIVSGILCAVLLGAAGASFVSCDDREADIRTELKGEMGVSLDRLREDLQSQLDALDDQIKDLKECSCEKFDPRLENVEKQVKDLEDWKKKTQDLLDVLEKFMNEHQDEVGITEARVLEILEDYAKKADYVLRTELEDSLKNYYTKDEVDAAFATKAELTAAVAALEGEDSRIWAALDNYLLIDDLEQEVLQILEDGHYATWEWVENYVRTFMENEIIPTLTDIIESHVKEVLLNMVTGIEINGTENPIFGGAALPADVRTTVLAAYHGVASKQVLSFPLKAEDIADRAGLGTIEGFVPFDAGETLLDDAADNAGTLYLTINPASIDFTGKKLELVSSTGRKAPITLSDAEECTDKELSFGYSRANDQGFYFYKSKAHLDAEDIDDARMNIDFNNLKNSVKNVIDQRSKSSIAKLAANLFSESSNILPAYAVKATYVNDLNKENGEEPTTLAVLSQYSIAATTVKPLSFDFMKGVQYDIPGLERIEKTIGDAIDNVFGQIKKAIPDFSELGEINIGKIELQPDTKGKLSSIKIRIQFEQPFEAEVPKIKVPEGNVVDEQGNVIGHYGSATITPDPAHGVVKVDQEVEITEFGDIFDDIINDINGSLDLDQLSDALENLKSISNVGSDLDDMRDELKNKVFGYIDRINGAFNTLTGSVNAALQPCLLFLDNNGNVAGRVTTSTLGTQVKGTSITLVPTSYTAELFAPAYKKLVAVTAVNGEIGNVCAKYNTGNLGKVISGNNWEGLELKGLEAGNTYEITYSALDYSGVEITKTYYISVK